MEEEFDFYFYNKIYQNGGHNQLYFKKAEELDVYYQSWKTSYDFIINNNVKKIIDLGCGPGHFASLFENDTDVIYEGYDFSDVAIEQAKKLINSKSKNIKFFVKNLKEIEFNENNNFFVAFEFLEHISFDLEILKKLKIGDKIIFSVPDYDSMGHFRFFKNESDIESHYASILDLTLLKTINVGKKNKIYLYYGIKK